ncbi:MAG: hypothetical protein M3Q14_01580 [bacterium]|nr:hypothetical protein [bacterium]
MKYHYQTGLFAPFAQRHYKQLVLAIAAVFMGAFGLMTALSSAAPTTVVVTPANT